MDASELIKLLKLKGDVNFYEVYITIPFEGSATLYTNQCGEYYKNINDCINHINKIFAPVIRKHKIEKLINDE